MGNFYKDKWVLFDERQLKKPLAQDMNELLDQVYDYMRDEVARFDDVPIEFLDITGIVSERFDTSQEFDGYKGREIVRTGQSWNQFLKTILTGSLALPDKHVERYLETGSTGKLRKWTRKQLESGKSYQKGRHREHEAVLESFYTFRGDIRENVIPGFSTSNSYYDSYSGEYCDMRAQDYGTGQRFIVEMKNIIGP